MAAPQETAHQVHKYLTSDCLLKIHGNQAAEEVIHRYTINVSLTSVGI